ncbi:MAG: helix-turn-helix transcriptional regulator [Streptosporangiaceae bacterium]
MPTEYAPTVRGRRLAAELRKLRENAKLTPENAATLLGFTRPWLVKRETAMIVPTLADVELILGAYGGTNQALHFALRDIARRIRERGWWVGYGDVLDDSYAELEDAASKIKVVQKEVVTGLLQTSDYARVLIGEFTDDPSETDRRLQARLTRQTILQRSPAPRLEVVFSEEVLRRPVGGVEVMREQLAALVTAAEKPNVSIRIVPLSRGHYPALGQGSMSLFQFEPKVELDTAHVETIAGSRYIEEVEEVNRCTAMFERVASAALPRDESRDLMTLISKGEAPVP